MGRRGFTQLAIALASFVALALPHIACGQTMHYRLVPGSEIVAVCDDCDGGETRAEILRGSFDVTVLPVAGQSAIEAITGVRWTSESSDITGSGFLQRIAEDELAIVIDARINGVSTLLTSGRRQRLSNGKLHLMLASPRDAAQRSIVTLIAEPIALDGPDRDGDGAADNVDNCADLANVGQSDADGDHVGDACDVCTDTPSGELVLEDGCAAIQRCPCDGPTEEREWSNHREYVQCVARALKDLRRQGRITRHEIVERMQTAVRSSCGRRELALR